MAAQDPTVTITQHDTNPRFIEPSRRELDDLFRIATTAYPNVTALNRSRSADQAFEGFCSAFIRTENGFSCPLPSRDEVAARFGQTATR